MRERRWAVWNAKGRGKAAFLLGTLLALGAAVLVGAVGLGMRGRSRGPVSGPGGLALPLIDNPLGWDLGPVADPYARPGDVDATAVFVGGGTAYVGLADRVVCYDVSAPESPVFLGRTEKLETIVVDIVGQGSYIYVAVQRWTVPASHTSGGEEVSPSVLTFDVSDPSAPSLVDWLAYPRSVYGLVLGGSTLYVATGRDGVSLVSLSEPAHPSVATTLAFTNATALALGGQYLYVSDRGDAESLPQPGGTPTVDVTPPANTTGTPPGPKPPSIRIVDMSAWPGADPEEVGVLMVDYWADCIAADAEYMYYYNYFGIYSIDVGDVSNPISLSHLTIRGARAADLQLHGDELFVAEEPIPGLAPTTGIEVMDVTNPARPDPLAYRDLWEGASAIAVVDGYAYVAGGDGLAVYDVSTPAEPNAVASTRQTRSWLAGVVATGPYAYVADWYRGLVIYDISQAMHPLAVSVTALEAPDRVNEVALDVVGDYAYVAGGGRLRVFDVSDPEVPALVGTSTELRSGDRGARDVVVAAGRAYIATGDGLVIVDVSDPGVPAVLSASLLPENDVVMVDGTYVYVPAGDGLYVLDVTTPVTPTEVARIPPKALDYGVQAGTAVYSIGAGDGVDIFDVSTPGSPAYVGAWPGVMECNGIEVYRDLLFFLTSTQGVRIVDPTGPGGMTEVGTIDPDGYGFGIGFSGDFAFVVRGDGYEIVDVSDPESPNVVYSADAPG